MLVLIIVYMDEFRPISSSTEQRNLIIILTLRISRLPYISVLFRLESIAVDVLLHQSKK